MVAEKLLAEALRQSLVEASLAEVACDLDLPKLVDSEGGETEIDRVDHLSDAGFLTDDEGVVVALSDGTEYTIKVVQNR